MTDEFKVTLIEKLKEINQIIRLFQKRSLKTNEDYIRQLLLIKQVLDELGKEVYNPENVLDDFSCAYITIFVATYEKILNRINNAKSKRSRKWQNQ